MGDKESVRNAAPPLPRRPGPPPRTTAWAPHIQQDQLAPAEMVAALAERVFAFADVEERPGTVAHPAERAIWLRDEIPAGPTDPVSALGQGLRSGVCIRRAGALIPGRCSV